MLSTVSGTEQVLNSSISASVGITVNIVYRYMSPHINTAELHA